MTAANHCKSKHWLSFKQLVLMQLAPCANPPQVTQVVGALGVKLSIITLFLRPRTPASGQSLQQWRKDLSTP